MIKAILTDIEGTTSSISFVKDVLFPYARERMPAFLHLHADRPEVKEQLAAVRSIAGTDLDLEACIAQLCLWIDEDQKVTPLKTLQGMIWDEGYRQGDFFGHLYLDAYEGMRDWHAQGIALYVFSSGSIKAQKLLFSHTEFGDLTPWFRAYFDTTTGSKQEPASYEAIRREIAHQPQEILFLSDVEAELDAAAQVGFLTRQLLRAPLPTSSGRHLGASSFAEIDVDALNCFQRGN
jgi:enolase-phosphatase E1